MPRLSGTTTTQGNLMKHKTLWAWIFLGPPLLAYVAVVLVPALFSFYDSLTNASTLGGPSAFIGLDNYTRLLDDPAFWKSLQNTAIWTLVAVTAPLLISLLIALALDRMTRLSRVVKTMFFMPLALSLVVVGQIWIWILSPEDGLLNIALRAVGLADLAMPWLADQDTALGSVLVAWSWQQIALSIIIFLAGLTAVSSELSEAAKMDGVNPWQHFRHVVWPALIPSLVVVVSLALINALKSFDIVYVMTAGGPFRSTETLAVFSYRIAFNSYDSGYASAAAVVLFILTAVIIGAFAWTNRQEARRG
jgi:ABC-type sugar transport system permease subunit